MLVFGFCCCGRDYAVVVVALREFSIARLWHVLGSLTPKRLNILWKNKTSSSSYHASYRACPMAVPPVAAARDARLAVLLCQLPHNPHHDVRHVLHHVPQVRREFIEAL